MEKHIKIIDADYHRNGISGLGFHTIIFKYGDMKMFATLFEGPGACAVLEFSQLSEGDIAFMTNGWRGDHFETELRKAIKPFMNKKWKKLLKDCVPLQKCEE